MPIKFDLKYFAALAGIALLAVPCPTDAQPSRKPAPRLPIIIFILADDLGYGDLGCYGQTMIKTPNIDKLAEEGMRFTDFYAGDTVCAPSRCTLMTGLHTGHARIRSNGEIPLKPEDLTVAELLKHAHIPSEPGYSTCALGKWGMGELGSTGTPGKKGFDEWFGYLNQVDAHNYYPTVLNRFDGRRRPGEQETQRQIKENLDGHKGKYSDDFFTEAALNFLGYSKPEWNNHYRPFFLYLAYTIPHANNELGNKTGNGMEVPDDQPYSNESWPQVEKNKAAMITLLDTYVGKIMDKLHTMGMDKNTIVFFSSDNGGHKEGGVDPKFFHSNGPLRGIKRDMYEGGIRVPFIAWWPGHIKAGATSDLPAAFWDFLPTAADLARMDAPTNIDGISFLPTLLGQPQTNRHEFLYWEFHEGGFKQAVRMGDWKAVRFGLDGPLQLYNLKNDLGEKNNVAADNPQVVAKIENYLKTARSIDTNWPTATAAQTSKLEYGADKPATARQ
jgi:arylsulfatase A-like enzyme